MLAIQLPQALDQLGVTGDMEDVAGNVAADGRDMKGSPHKLSRYSAAPPSSRLATPEGAATLDAGREREPVGADLGETATAFSGRGSSRMVRMPLMRSASPQSEPRRRAEPGRRPWRSGSVYRERYARDPRPRRRPARGGPRRPRAASPPPRSARTPAGPTPARYRERTLPAATCGSTLTRVDVPGRRRGEAGRRPRATRCRVPPRGASSPANCDAVE